MPASYARRMCGVIKVLTDSYVFFVQSNFDFLDILTQLFDLFNEILGVQRIYLATDAWGEFTQLLNVLFDFVYFLVLFQDQYFIFFENHLDVFFEFVWIVVVLVDLL